MNDNEKIISEIRGLIERPLMNGEDIDEEKTMQYFRDNPKFARLYIGVASDQIALLSEILLAIINEKSDQEENGDSDTQSPDSN